MAAGRRPVLRDAAALGEGATLGQRRIEAGEQPLNRAGAHQLFAEQPDRLGLRNRVMQCQPGEAHERQPVAQLVLGGVIGQRLQHQDAEHQHRIIGRPSPGRRGREDIDGTADSALGAAKARGALPSNGTGGMKTKRCQRDAFPCRDPIDGDRLQRQVQASLADKGEQAMDRTCGHQLRRDALVSIVAALLLTGSITACEGMTTGEKGAATGAAIGTGIALVTGAGVATTVGAALIGGGAGFIGGSAIDRQ
jgi:hypothetical protein